MTTTHPTLLAAQHVNALRAGLAYLPADQRALPADLQDSIDLAEAVVALPKANLAGALERRLGAEIAATGTAATLDAAITAAAAEAWRQQVLNAMRAPMVNGCATRTIEAAHRAAAILRKRALPVFAKHTAALTAAAKLLPSPDPLDARAVIEADVGKAFTDAKAHVGALIAIGGLVSVVAPRHVTPSAGPIIAVIDPGEVEMEMLHPQTEGRLNTDTALAHINVVRALLDAADKDITATMIMVARGEFDGITTALAEPGDPMAARAEAFSRAQVQRRAYEVHRGHAVLA